MFVALWPLFVLCLISKNLLAAPFEIKIHDELVREIFVYCPEALREPLARRILDDQIQKTIKQFMQQQLAGRSS